MFLVFNQNSLKKNKQCVVHFDVNTLNEYNETVSIGLYTLFSDDNIKPTRSDLLPPASSPPLRGGPKGDKSFKPSPFF